MHTLASESGLPHPGESGETLHPCPPQKLAFTRLQEKSTGGFDSKGLVSSGLTALPGCSDSFQTLSYFRSRKFITAKIGGDGVGRGKGEGNS